MNVNEDIPKQRNWFVIASVLTLVLLVASCIAIQKTNVITSTIVLQIGKDISFQNGEDLPEVTVGGVDAPDKTSEIGGKGIQVVNKHNIKAVYHLTSGMEEVPHALENILNHLSADPNVKIVVVVNGNGIEFMLEGAKDRDGKPFAAAINDIKLKGVDFLVCGDTLNTRNIDKTRVISEATIIPSGVAEIARLQFREGYAYLRP